MIVSTFMLGLGTGAVIGGWLADKFDRKRILIFSLIEMTIGIFGLFSLYIMDHVGALFVAASLANLTIITFLLFIVPTSAMGATLPVLVTELVGNTHNVGLSTGALYCVNTLGAAAGALATGILLSWYGLDGLVTIGAMMNCWAISLIAGWLEGIGASRIQNARAPAPPAQFGGPITTRCPAKVAWCSLLRAARMRY
jgi:MFS family permease